VCGRRRVGARRATARPGAPRDLWQLSPTHTAAPGLAAPRLSNLYLEICFGIVLFNHLSGIAHFDFQSIPETGEPLGRAVRSVSALKLR